MSVRSHAIDVRGLRFHLEERGAGRPLLVLHGFTGSSASMAEICQALSRQRRVLALDLIGHGASSAPPDVAPYRMEQCLLQIRAVLAALEIQRTDVLGYSMGGRAALCLLAHHTEVVDHALVVGASAGLEGAEDRAARMASDEALALRIEQEGLPAFVDYWMGLPLFASQAGRLSSTALAHARQQRLANRPHGLANSLRGMGTGAQPPVHDALTGIDRSVLFAVGDEDAKFEGIAHDLAGRMPGAEVAIVPQAGHAAHLENPAVFTRIAEAFLGRAKHETP